MNEAKISIIVPVYGVEEYLDRCVQSLLVQTYSNCEIVLVDDGSPDACPAMCDGYAEKYPNVVSVHKQNGGLGSARNFGVGVCTGEYVAFIDSDDYVEKTYVEDLYNLLTEFGGDVSVNKVVRRDGDVLPKAHQSAHFEPYVTGGKGALLDIYFHKRVGWHAVGKLYKKSIIERFPFPDGYYEDFAVMYEILTACERVAIGCNVNNYHYICRKGSILKQAINPKHLHIFELCDEVCAMIDREYEGDVVFKMVVCKNAQIQLLNLVDMDRASYKRIFNQYKKFYRKNVGKALRDKRLGKKDKAILWLLSTSSWFFKTCQKIF